MRICLLLGLMLISTGCSQTLHSHGISTPELDDVEFAAPDEQLKSMQQTAAAKEFVPTNADDLNLKERAGQEIVVQGIANNTKLAAVVSLDGDEIQLNEIEAWPVDIAGKPVRVEGILTEGNYGQPEDFPREDRYTARAYGHYWKLTQSRWRRIENH